MSVETSAVDEWLGPLRRRLQARGDGDLACALGDPVRYDSLSERRKAELDAAVYGLGVIVAERRVDPTSVVLIRPESGDPRGAI